MGGNAVRGKWWWWWWGGWAECENPVRFSLNDGPMETVEYMWVNIWCILDWIIGFLSKD